jgi:hypothetical protein
MMGTEIRTFRSMKEMSDSLADQIAQYKNLSEDYSEWLGSLLRGNTQERKLGSKISCHAEKHAGTTQEDGGHGSKREKEG